MNLIIATGPWQALMASAAIRQIGLSNEDVFAVTVTTAGEEHLVQPCQRIHEAEGHRYLGSIARAHLQFGSRHPIAPDILKALRSTRRIWACSICDSVSAAMAQTAPRVPVALFEDGLMSCVPHFVYGDQWQRRQVSRGLLWRSYVKRSLLSRQLLLRKPDYERVELIVTCLDELYDDGEMLPVPKVRMEMENLRTAIMRGALPSVSFPQANQPRALVAGSNFSKQGVIFPSQEYKVIEDSISLLRDGHEVWWKPHPRADLLYTRYLQLRFPELKVLDGELASAPIEALIPCMNPRILVSPFSSSLLYARKLHGTETRRSPGFDALLPLLNNPAYDRIYGILKRHVAVIGAPDSLV